MLERLCVRIYVYIRTCFFARIIIKAKRLYAVILFILLASRSKKKVERKVNMAQYKYSVGDRVRVVWEDAVYDAAVITVHANNAVDVVYAVSGCIGLSLTAAEHVLQLVGGDGKPKEKPEVIKQVKVRV